MEQLPKGFEISGIDSESSQKKILRVFSKRRFPEDRQNLAQRIVAGREAIHRERVAWRERLTAVRNAVVEQTKSVEAVIAELRLLEEEKEKKSSNLFSSLWHRSRIEVIEAQTQEKKGVVEEIQENINQDEEIIRNLEAQLANREELEKLEDEISEFYSNVEGSWNQFIEELKARKVSAVVEKYGVILIHAIHPFEVPGENSLLKEGVSWETKLKICLAFRPTVSASSIKPGDNGNNMWARMGLILSEGLIEQASPRDRATVARGLRKRTSAIANLDIRGDIDLAIRQREKDSYNELVIGYPGVAGVYYSEDNQADNRLENLLPLGELVEICKSLNIPLFFLRNGVVYESQYDDRGILVEGQQIAPYQILERTHHISSEMRTRLVEEIREEKPFRGRLHTE